MRGWHTCAVTLVTASQVLPAAAADSNFVGLAEEQDAEVTPPGDVVLAGEADRTGLSQVVFGLGVVRGTRAAAHSSNGVSGQQGALVSVNRPGGSWGGDSPPPPTPTPR